MVLLHLKGIAAFQTFKGARNQWFWLPNRKLKAFPFLWAGWKGWVWNYHFPLKDRRKVWGNFLKKQQQQKKKTLSWSPEYQPWLIYNMEKSCLVAWQSRQQTNVSDRLSGISWSEILFAPFWLLPLLLSGSPPSVPPSLKGAPGRAWSYQAGPGPTGYSGPAGLFLSVSICKMPVVLRECFSHHKCWLGSGPVWKPWRKSLQNLSCPQRLSWSRVRAWGDRLIDAVARGCLWRYRRLMGSAAFAEHGPLPARPRKRPLEEPGWPWEAPLGLIEDSSPCALPHPTL